MDLLANYLRHFFHLRGRDLFISIDALKFIYNLKQLCKEITFSIKN